MVASGDPTEKTMTIQYRLLACEIPLYKDTGLMINYSYLSKNPNEAFEQELNEFLAGIKVQK